MIDHLMAIMVLHTLFARSYITSLQTWKKKRGMDLFPFLLASADVAAQAAGAPLAASLAREITQSCLAISYYTHPALFCSVFVPVCLFRMT